MVVQKFSQFLSHKLSLLLISQFSSSVVGQCSYLFNSGRSEFVTASANILSGIRPSNSNRMVFIWRLSATSSIAPCFQNQRFQILCQSDSFQTEVNIAAHRAYAGYQPRPAGTLSRDEVKEQLGIFFILRARQDSGVGRAIATPSAA